jgi:hypothetical protein
MLRGWELTNDNIQYCIKAVDQFNICFLLFQEAPFVKFHNGLVTTSADELRHISILRRMRKYQKSERTMSVEDFKSHV